MGAIKKRLQEECKMPYVITEKCLGERYATCVDVCPVTCIYPGEHKGEVYMVIDPEVCIDCGACLPECPIEAIVASPDEAEPEAVDLNAKYSPEWKEHAAVEPRPANDPPRKQH